MLTQAPWGQGKWKERILQGARWKKKKKNPENCKNAGKVGFYQEAAGTRRL